MSFKLNGFTRLVAFIIIVIMTASTFAVLYVPPAAAEEGTVLKGYVTDEKTGGPLDGVGVNLWDGENGFYDESDVMGYYEITVDAGEYDLYASKEGYHSTGAQLTIEGDVDNWYNFTMEEKPPETSMVKGYVDEMDRGPIENADVYIGFDDHWNGTRTDSSGYYEMNVGEGDYEIDVSKDGYHSYHNNDLHVGKEETVWYNVSLKEKPPETSTIKGYVMDESRAAVEDAEFDIWGKDYSNHTYTDATGYYEINIAEGKYDLEVRKEDYKKHQYQGLEIGSEETVWYNVTLEPLPPANSVIKGYVMDETRAGLQDANVNLWEDDLDYHTMTDEQGYYEMNVAGGKYDSRVSLEGYRDHWEWGLEIPDEDTVWFNVTLEEKPPENSIINGHVTDKKSGDPIYDAEVTIHNEDYYWARTDDKGYYEIQVSAGDWEIDVDMNGYHHYWNDGLHVDENDTLVYDVAMDPKPPENSVIKGYVMEESRGPVEGVDVNINDGNDWNGTQTDHEGYYEINVAEGRYDLEINSDDHKRHEKKGINIGPNETYWYNATLEERPPENSIIKGYVMEDARSPVEGADVYVWGDVGYHEQTDPNRYYEMQVGEGDYHFSVRKEGYRDYDDEIYIPPDSVIWYNVTIEQKPPANAVVKGYVSDNSRAALEDAEVNIENNNDHFGTRTNDEGYYEIELNANKYEIIFRKYGYHSHKDDIDVQENDTFWYNVTLEEAEMVMVRGYVKDNETGDPIVDEYLQFANGDAYYPLTDDEGYYEIELPAEETYEVYFRPDGYRSFEEYFYIDQDIWINITLDPVPPEDVLIRGFVTDNSGRGAVEGMVMAYNIDMDVSNQTDSDKDTGYYEMRAWSDWCVIMAMAQDYYTFSHLEMVAEGEYWYNITLYPVQEASSSIFGFVRDHDIIGVDGAQVILVNNWTGMPIDNWEDHVYYARTEIDGYYEIDVPDGDWYVLSQDYYGSGAIVEVTVNGATRQDITYQEPDMSDISAEFLDWDNAMMTSRMPFDMDGSPDLIRALVDFLGGNGNGFVEAGEAANFAEFLKVMMGNDSEDPDKENTEDDMETDGIYYDFGEEHPFKLTGLQGDTTNDVPPYITMEVDLESHETIPENDKHEITINISYDRKDSDPVIKLVIPGFAGHVISTENVDVVVDNDMITLTFIGEHKQDEWEIVRIIVNSTDFTNIAPVADAGNDIMINEGDTANFQGTGTDTDGTIVLYEWDFDGDGTYDWQSTTTGITTHAYFVGNDYFATIRVTDNDGAVDTDEVMVSVNILPIVDAGDDQTINAGETAEFQATASDHNGAIVLYEWDFDGDGTWDFQSTTSDEASHTYAGVGTYTVKVSVTDDSGAVVMDQLTVQVKKATSGPDLQIESLSLSKLSIKDGDKVTITATLANDGDAPARDITIVIQIDDEVKDTITITVIGAGETRDVVYNWTTSEGDHTIVVNLTYKDGDDVIERKIKVSGKDDGPGFELMLAIIAVGAAMVLHRKKRR